MRRTEWSYLAASVLLHGLALGRLFPNVAEPTGGAPPPPRRDDVLDVIALPHPAEPRSRARLPRLAPRVEHAVPIEAAGLAGIATSVKEAKGPVTAGGLGIAVTYPRLSRLLREEGRVVVGLHAGGAVSVATSSGHERLDRAALAAADSALKSGRISAEAAPQIAFVFRLNSIN